MASSLRRGSKGLQALRGARPTIIDVRDAETAPDPTKAQVDLPSRPTIDRHPARNLGGWLKKPTT